MTYLRISLYPCWHRAISSTLREINQMSKHNYYRHLNRIVRQTPTQVCILNNIDCWKTFNGPFSDENLGANNILAIYARDRRRRKNNQIQ